MAYKKEKHHQEEVAEGVQVDQYQERWLRAEAELENLRKRFTAERQDLLRFGQESLIEKLLPVIDNFERATSFIPEDQQSSAWVTGIQYIQKNLMDTLEAEGVSVIDPRVGEAFDHNTQEAIGTQETSEMEEDHIIQVVAKGYRLNGRLIRPAKVTVSIKK